MCSVSHGLNVDNKIPYFLKKVKKVEKALSLTIPAFAGISFLSTNDYFTGIFQPNAQVVQNKNWKFEINFYSFLNKHL